MSERKPPEIAPIKMFAETPEEADALEAEESLRKATAKVIEDIVQAHEHEHEGQSGGYAQTQGGGHADGHITPDTAIDEFSVEMFEDDAAAAMTDDAIAREKARKHHAKARQKSNKSPKFYPSVLPYANRPMMDSGMDRRRRVSWVISFTDLMALMLSFFVMLYSMSQPKPILWTQMTESLREQYGGLEQQMAGYAGPQDQQTQVVIRPANEDAMDLGYLEGVLQNVIRQMPPSIQDNVRLMDAGDRIIMAVPPVLTFAPNDATPSDRAVRFLALAAPFLKAIDNQIVVVGYAAGQADAQGTTGAVPQGQETSAISPESDEFVLSLRRAQAVADVLAAYGYERPMTVIGGGAGRQQTLPQDFDPQTRMYFARRVDIVILNKK